MDRFIEELQDAEESGRGCSLYFPVSSSPVDLFVTGWNRQLQRPVEISVRSDLLPAEPSIRVATLPVNSKVRVNSRSWFFAAPPDELVFDSKENVSETENSEANNIEANNFETDNPETDNSETGNPETENLELNNIETDIENTKDSGLDESVTFGAELIKDDIETLTRIRIPRDAVKVQDRLSYILQPPIESILHLPTLDLPFEPFPYQRQGIAFLYSAHFAILADEMGLGKTMQAITTIL
ncbi:MAG: hypothetical protein LBF88_11320 [Planctomycetaceae bacterium]|jgi:SNF2 family DNA or RNA helicase|nr:hypothetical protein [Planctomycetaceae bacterium]